MRVRVRREARGGCRRQHGRDGGRALQLRRAAARAAGAGDQVAVRVQPRSHGRRGSAGPRDRDEEGGGARRQRRAGDHDRAREPDRVRDVRSAEGHVGQATGWRDLTRRDIDCPDVFEPARRHARRAADQDPAADRGLSRARRGRRRSRQLHGARAQPEHPLQDHGRRRGRRQVRSAAGRPVRRRIRHRRRHAPSGRRDRCVGGGGDAARVSGVGPQPHHARS